MPALLVPRDLNRKTPPSLTLLSPSIVAHVPEAGCKWPWRTTVGGCVLVAELIPAVFVEGETWLAGVKLGRRLTGDCLRWNGPSCLWQTEAVSGGDWRSCVGRRR
ncbi:DNA-directed RNA polymerase subunit beta' [Striga asiatica]|uniref:DNA-directed RNA polymerase subunit beta n=1 Tax=Striga asiatica TaxID=4170 RepID=A0A5A7Q9R8_STRAF|nr:DNA-directed RNA polymerase subunit beta' [Striga asiatica]